jgi:hypothetical protein
VKRFLALPLLLVLGGCVTDGVGSVKGGECKVFDAPAYEIRGATQHDQDWIDPTIESGVGACKWKRPAARPAAWDAPGKPVQLNSTPAKKPRLLRKVWPKAAVAPVVPVPTVPSAASLIPPAPVLATRSALEELLHPIESGL